MVEERKWPAAVYSYKERSSHTPADGGRYHIHLLAARLHNNKVESRPAPITTRDGNEIKLDGHASSRRVFPSILKLVPWVQRRLASQKDDFPLPHIDVLVDNTAGHGMLSFMDAFSWYNQIKMAEEDRDREKTAFITISDRRARSVTRWCRLV